MIITIKGGTVNLSQLSSSMIRPKWTITKLVDAMESDGLVIRVSSTQDRRSTLVSVTRSGLAELEKSLTLCDKAEKEIMDSLGKNEISTFEMVSRLLISRLVEVTSAYHDSSFYFHRGIFYKALGRKDAALTNFKRALETTGEKSFIRRIKEEVAELKS